MLCMQVGVKYGLNYNQATYKCSEIVVCKALTKQHWMPESRPESGRCRGGCMDKHEER